MQSVSLVIVEPSQLFREGLRLLLRDPPHHIAAAAASLAEAFEKTMAAPVQLILWGPGCRYRAEADLLWLRQRIGQAAEPQSPIRHVLLTNIADAAWLRQIGWHEFDAVLSQDISCEVLQRSLELVMLGQQLYPAFLVRNDDQPIAGTVSPQHATAPPSVFDRQAENPRGGPAPSHNAPKAELIPFPLRTGPWAPISMVDKPRPVMLSEREGQTLRCLLDGASNKAIARQLGLTETTVKAHLKGLLRKLRISNRTQAAIWARDNNELVMQAIGSRAGPHCQEAERHEF